MGRHREEESGGASYTFFFVCGGARRPNIRRLLENPKPKSAQRRPAEYEVTAA